MTLPNGIDGISEAIGTLFASGGPLTPVPNAATWGANPISEMNTLTQSAVTEKIKQNQILASTGWNSTTAALYEGLRRGNPSDGNVPLITSSLEAMVNKLFGTNIQWPTNAEVIAAIERVPLMTELVGALQSIYKGLTGQESVTDVLADLNTDIQTALSEIQNNTGQFLDDVLVDLGLPTSEASAFAAWLSGSAAGQRITNVSSAVIVNGNQQLLESPNFAGAISIAGNGIWTWNSTIYYIIPGETVDEPGSAQVTANGTTQILTSTPAEDIPLGQPVDYSIRVCTNALTGSGTLLQLVAIPWIGTIAQTPVVLASSAAPTGATTGWTNPPSGSKATVLSGVYTPTTSSGITAVSMQLVLTNAALSGTVYWSAASEELTGGLINDLVNENAAGQQASATYWTSLGTAVNQILGGNWSGGFATAENAWQTYQVAQAGVASAQYVTLHQLLSMVGINTGSGMMAASNVTSALGGASLGGDVVANKSAIDTHTTNISSNASAISSLNSSVTAQKNAQATLFQSWQTTLNNAGQSQAAKIAAMESAWTTYMAANSSITSGQFATISQMLGQLFGYDTTTGQLGQSYVAGLQTSQDQFAAAMTGDTSTNSGPWAWLAQIVNSYYTMTGQAHNTSVDNANTLGIRNNMPVYNGLDNTSVANMPLTAVNTTPGSTTAAINWTSTSTFMSGSLVRFPGADSRGSISFIVGKSSASAAWPTSFFVNAYRWNAVTQKLTYLFSSTNLAGAFPSVSSTVPQWMQWVFPSTIAVAAGDVLAFMFQPIAPVGSDQFYMYGMPSLGSGLGNHPTAVLSNFGCTAFPATAGTHASGDLSLGTPPLGSTLWSYGKNAPYVSVELAGLVAPTYPPSPSTYTMSGSQVLDSWVNFVDLIGVGQGGGGQGETGGTVGRGGSPGQWNGQTLVVGTDIAASGTISWTIQANPSSQGTSEPGSGGAYFGDGQDGVSTVFTWTKPGVGVQTLTCPGGLGGGIHNGANGTTYGQGPGNFIFPSSGPNVKTYIGGAAALTPEPGNPPGGSGPGGQPFQYGFNGARGQAWIVERYS